MALDVGGRIFAESKVNKFGGQAGLGYHLLLVWVDLSVHAWPPPDQPVLTELVGLLMVQGKDGVQRWVGRLQPFNAPVTLEARDYAQTHTETLELELDRRRLEAIEDVRLGGDLTFAVQLRGRVRRGGSLDTVSEQMGYRVNQGTWIEILHDLGYASTMLLEVPMPDAGEAPEFSKCVKHIGEAHVAMTRGQWREAVGCCRDVLESLEGALPDRDVQDAEVQALFENTRSMDKAGRLRTLRRALKVLSHPARHADQVSARHEWDRRDAVMMVSMIAALLNGLRPASV